MRAQPVDLIGGFYKDDSLPWSCQDTVNWLPVQAEVAGTRTVKKFSTAPGLKPYQQIGTGPIRGMHDCEGLRLVVSGRYLFRISNTGVGIPIGVIPGVGRVQMTHNQFKTGFQVLVENGQGGGGYVYTTATDTFAKITDEGYPGSISSDYLDSYILGVEPQGRFWFHSNLADATDYNTLDRYEAEAAPDRIVGLAVSASEVVVFGQRTTEFYFNAGQATGTFQNRKSSITRGCASRHTIQKLDNTLFWLGDDGVVYRLEGYAARPISTRPLEKAISGYNWPEAVAYTWEDRGHKVYYLTFPDGQTFGYDVITGEWHRRESFGMNRWRLSHTIGWGRDWFGGDFQNGRIWQIDWDYFLEGDQPIISERTSAVLSDNQSQLVLPNAELIFDTGHGPGTDPIPFPDQPPAPDISGTPPQGQMLVPYSYQFTLSGDFPPLIVSSEATLPVGLGVNEAGLLSGTPAASFSGSIFLRVTDARGMYSVKSFLLQIKGLSHWNAADKAANVVLSDEDQLFEVVVASSGGAGGAVRAVQSRSSGKYYVEFKWERHNAQFSGFVGLMQMDATLVDTPFSKTYSLGVSSINQFSVSNANSSGGGTPPISSGSVIGVAVDFGTKRCWMNVNGVWRLGDSPSSYPPGMFDQEIPSGLLAPAGYSTDNNTGPSHQIRLIVEGANMLYRPSGFQPWGGA